MRIIAGESRGRKIEAPAGMHTRPTLDRVRENMFNMIQPDVSGSMVLDLFAGSGALSLEALSRGAVGAVLVDSDRRASQVQSKNIENLRYKDRTHVLCCDWRKAIEQIKKKNILFDLVFLDPPYAMQNIKDVFSSLIPVIHEDTLLILEHESGKEFSISEQYTLVKSRSWGFCAVTIYRHIILKG